MYCNSNKNVKYHFQTVSLLFIQKSYKVLHFYSHTLTFFENYHLQGLYDQLHWFDDLWPKDVFWMIFYTYIHKLAKEE